MAGSSAGSWLSVASDGASGFILTSRLLAVAHHIHMGNAGVEVFAADDGKAKPFIESSGLHLGAEHLLLQATLFRFRDHRAQQRIADFQATPVLEHRNPADMPVRQQARGTNRVIALVDEKMQGL